MLTDSLNSEMYVSLIFTSWDYTTPTLTSEPDDGEQFAVPPDPLIKATPDTIEQFMDWVYTKVDTLGPVIGTSSCHFKQTG